MTNFDAAKKMDLDELGDFLCDIQWRNEGRFDNEDKGIEVDHCSLCPVSSLCKKHNRDSKELGFVAYLKQQSDIH